jgi:outer membrane receptor protein involved in Fe transport
LKSDGTRTDFFLNGTYLQLRQRVTAIAPELELAGTVFNPPRIKGRGGASYNVGPISATGTLNYTGSFVNTYQHGDPRVSAWWTVDAQVAYVPRFTSGMLQGLRISASVQNLFDKSPPYVLYDGSYPGFHYDSLNATPLGRFVTLLVATKW